MQQTWEKVRGLQCFCGFCFLFVLSFLFGVFFLQNSVSKICCKISGICYAQFKKIMDTVQYVCFITSTITFFFTGIQMYLDTEFALVFASKLQRCSNFELACVIKSVLWNQNYLINDFFFTYKKSRKVNFHQHVNTFFYRFYFRLIS